MRKGWVAVVMGALMWACGGGGPGLPDDKGPDAKTPDTPALPDGGGEQQEVNTSLWPLTQGSTWTYRIDDPLLGIFEKHVEVLGVMDIPGTSAKAVAVKSTQPHLEELSWQIVHDGVVLRVREEDTKNGQLARVTTWDPLIMKSLDVAQAPGWSRTETVTETIFDGAGNVMDTKQKDFAWGVDEAGVSITTPAGTFEGAVKLRRLRSDKDNYDRSYWLVPGVGKVRETGERTEELIRYEIKAAPAAE